MRKAIFFTLFLLAITLAMLFYLKTEGVEKAVSGQNSIITPKQTPPEVDESGAYVKISFLDIGQGDASFIEYPSGKQMLVDCARDARVLGALGRVMKYYDKEIDYLIVTHPDIDHYGGCIDVLKQFDVKNIVYTGLQKEDKTWQYFWDMIQKENARYTEIVKSDVWQIDGVKINFLYPDHDITQDANVPGLNKNVGDNNTSLVFQLSYGTQDVLFTGDMEEPLEKYLIDTYGHALDSEALKVGHHGSGSSSSQDFINLVSPNFSIISVGKDNDYGHPSRRVLKRLERVGSDVWRTDKTGDTILQMGENNIVK